MTSRSKVGPCGRFDPRALSSRVKFPYGPTLEEAIRRAGYVSAYITPDTRGAVDHLHLDPRKIFDGWEALSHAPDNLGMPKAITHLESLEGCRLTKAIPHEECVVPVAVDGQEPISLSSAQLDEGRQGRSC